MSRSVFTGSEQELCAAFIREFIAISRRYWWPYATIMGLWAAFTLFFLTFR